MSERTKVYTRVVYRSGLSGGRIGRVLSMGVVVGLIAVFLLLAVQAPAQGYVPTPIEYSEIEDICQGAVVSVVNETDYYQVVGAALLTVLPSALGFRLLANSFRVASDK